MERIASLLSPGRNESDDNVRLIQEFLSDYRMQLKLFYPSANADNWDILFINEIRLREINGFEPTIFIHSDRQTLDWNGEQYLKRTLSPSVEFRRSYSRTVPDGRVISIFKIGKPNNENRYWLIHFGGFNNEEVLKILIDDKTHVSVLYTSCDGITCGMGGIGYEYSVPTILYPLFYSRLGVRYHISDQSIEDAKGIIKDRGYAQLRNWLESILLITRVPEVEEMLKLDGDLMMNSVSDYISRLQEYDVNSAESTRIYHPGSLKLRKISC